MKRIILQTTLAIIAMLIIFGCKNDTPKDLEKKDCDLLINRMNRKSKNQTQTEMDVEILYDILNEPLSKLYEITHKADKGNLNIYFTCTKNDSIIYEKKLMNQKFAKNPGTRSLNIRTKTITSADRKKRHFHVNLTEYSSFGTAYAEDSIEVTVGRKKSSSEKFNLSYCLKNKERARFFNRAFSVGSFKDKTMDFWEFSLSAEVIEEL